MDQPNHLSIHTIQILWKVFTFKYNLYSHTSLYFANSNHHKLLFITQSSIGNKGFHLESKLQHQEAAEYGFGKDQIISRWNAGVISWGSYFIL